MTAKGPDVYWDVSTLDRVRVGAEVCDSEGPLWSDTKYFPIPEDIMEEIQDLLGDGNASVTVGNDVAVSDYGNKAGCSVFVKLTCNQDEESIERTRQVGQRLALRFAEDGLARAEQVLNKFLGKPTKEIEEQSFVDSTVKKTAAKGKVPKKIGTTKTLLKGKKTPSFRR